MAELTRTSTGRFKLENAVKLDEFKNAAAEGNAEKYIIPCDDVLTDYKKLFVAKSANKYLYNGGKIYKNRLSFDEEEPKIG